MERPKVLLVQEEPRGPSQLIEVPVPTNGVQRVNFPDIQQLRDLINQRIVIKAIRLITANVLTNGIISGSVTAPVTELQKMAIVLYCEGWEKAQYIPVLTLNDVTVPGSAIAHRYHKTQFDNWENVDWSKSYIQFANTTSSAGTPYVVMFDVEYVKLDASGREIVGPS